MQTAFTPNIIPTIRAEPSKINEKWPGKKVKFFPLTGKIKRKFTFFGKYQKYFISCIENISISLVLRTREITDIFNTFHEVYLVFV